MIGYLKGRVIWRDEDSETVTMLVENVGYEIRIPHIIWKELRLHRIQAEDSQELELFIYTHQTERQPRPMLIGFRNQVEREFFQRLIEVQDIGPTAAARALTLPVRVIARAIEARDVGTLRKLAGVGQKKAEKIVATLNGKMAKFALMREGEAAVHSEEPVAADDLSAEVIEVLTTQLGYRRGEATRMVEEVLEENPEIQTAEELFDAVYRAGRRQ